METYGALYVIGTPIGNLGDLSPRVKDTLEKVDWILCEDTRVTQKLLNNLNTRAVLASCHKFNEKQNLKKYLQLLKDGRNLALVSDAGTPAISDPGFHIINAAHKEEIPVHPIPGPSAVSTTCSISGFDCSKFIFLGYLPRKEGELTDLLNSHSEWSGPAVFFESPQRIEKTLLRLQKLAQEDFRLCLCREITKHYETIHRGKISEILQNIKSGAILKGEWTGVIENLKSFELKKNHSNISVEELAKFLSIKRSQAAKILSQITKQKRDTLYGKNKASHPD